MAKRRLCNENILHKHLHLLLDCRLVPLMKEVNGARPVGIGEVLKRIMCKIVVSTLGHIRLIFNGQVCHVRRVQG